jgi:cytochrome oxidase assembly protein ShyY1
MGYALQWFSFAVLLGGGYPFFVHRQQKRAKTAARGGSLPQAAS